MVLQIQCIQLWKLNNTEVGSCVVLENVTFPPDFKRPVFGCKSNYYLGVPARSKDSPVFDLKACRESVTL